MESGMWLMQFFIDAVYRRKSMVCCSLFEHCGIKMPFINLVVFPGKALQNFLNIKHQLILIVSGETC